MLDWAENHYIINMDHISLFEAIDDDMRHEAAGEEMYPDDLYHYAPTVERNRIQQHGLFPIQPPNPTHPQGVYTWIDDFSGAGSYGQGMNDLWRIPGGTIPTSQVKPWAAPGGTYTDPLTGKPVAAIIDSHYATPELYNKYEDRLSPSAWNDLKTPKQPLNPGELPPVNTPMTSPAQSPVDIQIKPKTQAPAAPTPTVTDAPKGFGAKDIARGLGKGMDALTIPALADAGSRGMESMGTPDFQGKSPADAIKAIPNQVTNTEDWNPTTDPRGYGLMQNAVPTYTLDPLKWVSDNTARPFMQNVVDPATNAIVDTAGDAWDAAKGVFSHTQHKACYTCDSILGESEIKMSEELLSRYSCHQCVHKAANSASNSNETRD